MLNRHNKNELLDEVIHAQYMAKFGCLGYHFTKNAFCMVIFICKMLAKCTNKLIFNFEQNNS